MDKKISKCNLTSGSFTVRAQEALKCTCVSSMETEVEERCKQRYKGIDLIQVYQLQQAK